MTNQKPNIYQRIVSVMNDVDPIEKRSTNKTKEGKDSYTFSSHDEVTGLLKPHFVKHGIAVIPTVSSLTQDGNRTVISMNVKFVNIDDPKDFIESNGWGYGIDSQDKGPGKAISYCFKYILLKMFCLSTGDDSDKHSEEYKKPEAKPGQVVNIDLLSFEEVLQIQQEIEKDVWIERDVLDTYKVKCFEDIQSKFFKQVLGKVRYLKAKGKP